MILLFFYPIKYLFFNSFFFIFYYFFFHPKSIIILSQIQNPQPQFNHPTTVMQNQHTTTQIKHTTKSTQIHNSLPPPHTHTHKKKKNTRTHTHNNPQKFHSNPCDQENPATRRWKKEDQMVPLASTAMKRLRSASMLLPL